MRCFNILLIIILFSLNVKSETILPRNQSNSFWFNNKIYQGRFLKESKSYRFLKSKHYWQYFLNGVSNTYGYYIYHDYDNFGCDQYLWSEKLSYSNKTINIINSNKFIIFSDKWFKGLDLKHSLSSQNSSCTWYEDNENIYPVLCGTADKIIYFPNFRGGFNWQVTYENPFIIKLLINKKTQQVSLSKLIEIPYSFKKFFHDATDSVKDGYENAKYIPKENPLNCTNYILVTKEKGFSVGPTSRLILMGILDNGKVFMKKTLLKKTNISLRSSRLHRISNNTYFLSYYIYRNIPAFNKKKIIKAGDISFVNVNAELPDDFIRENVSFYKKNVVLAGSVNNVATVIVLKYTNDKVIKKIHKFPDVNYEKYDRLITLLRPDHYVDIVLSKNQIEENVERDLPIIFTADLNEKKND
jgi:hypothetical protein